MARGVTVGAPPDAYSQMGQDWQQPPWRPDRLAELAYAPLRELFRNALRHGGGLRVDHIIGLFRLWWIPAGTSADAGTYVHYDHDALIGILALEAERAGAVIIGEDLGNVEPQVRGYLRERGLLGTSILWFEADPETGGPLPPQRWREYCLASVTTHDLPPTTGYLAGDHIRLRDRLGLLTRAVDEELAAAAESETTAWIAELTDCGLLPADAAPTPEDIVLALHRFLTLTPARLRCVALTDAVGERRTQNQPGTTEPEYPNWRVPLGGPDGRALLLEDVLVDPRVARWSTRSARRPAPAGSAQAADRRRRRTARTTISATTAPAAILRAVRPDLGRGLVDDRAGLRPDRVERVPHRLGGGVVGLGRGGRDLLLGRVLRGRSLVGGLGLDVELVAERVDGLGQLGAGLLDVGADGVGIRRRCAVAALGLGAVGLGGVRHAVAPGLRVSRSCLSPGHGLGRHRRRGLADVLLADQGGETGDREQHGADDEGGQPVLDRAGEAEDRGGDQAAQPVHGEQAGAAEQPGTEPGALALLGQLGLGQAQLVTDQAAGLLGNPGDEFAERRIGRVASVRSSRHSSGTACRSSITSLAGLPRLPDGVTALRSGGAVTSAAAPWAC